MKQNYLMALLAFVVVSSIFGASAIAGQKSRSDISAHVPTTELKWRQTQIGPEASPIQGDFTKGAHITYLKFPAGIKTPLHTHSADYVGIVIGGNMKHWTPGKPETEKKLPPGSHWFIPSKAKHISECLPGVECMLVIIQQQKFDFLPVKNDKP